MKTRLSGVSLTDDFAEQFVATRSPEGVDLVHLPRGRGVAEALDQLDEAVRRLGTSSVVVAAEVSRCCDLLPAITAAIQWDRPGCVEINDWAVRNADRLHHPCLMLMPLGPDIVGDEVSAILTNLYRLASDTKNLSGSLSFLVLVRGEGPVAEVPVWPPMTANATPIRFGRRERAAKRVGFEIYLGLRAYWDAAGQPDWLDALAPIQRGALAYEDAPDTDRRIDALVERHLPLDADFSAEFWRTSEGLIERARNGSLLATGLLDVEAGQGERWERVGIGWRPPGSVRLQLTPWAARHLAAPDSPFVASLGCESAARLLCATRLNHAIATWVLGLTGLVEREMLHACMADTGIESRMERCGMADRLREERARAARQSPDLGAHTLLEFASFGDLQTLVGSTELAARIPASGRKLNRVRHARNLCAHLHPVPWTVVREVLDLLTELASRREP